MISQKAIDIADNVFVVTGGASFIGSHIARALALAKAREVRLIDNFSSGRRDNIQDLLGRANVSLWEGDILHLDELVPILRGADGVFHTAGYVTSRLSARMDAGLSVNVLGTERLCLAAELVGVPRIVYSSSVSVYGNVAGAGITEDVGMNFTGFAPGPYVYGCSKLMGEAIGGHFASRGVLSFAALRYPSVYGVGMHSLGLNTKIMLELYRQLTRPGSSVVVEGDPTEAHDFICAVDVANANLAAMAAGYKGEALNISSGVSTKISEVVSTIAELLGRSEVGVRYVTPGVRITSAGELSYSNDRARERIGWSPVIGLEEGLRLMMSDLGRSSGAIDG